MVRRPARVAYESTRLPLESSSSSGASSVPAYSLRILAGQSIRFSSKATKTTVTAGSAAALEHEAACAVVSSSCGRDAPTPHAAASSSTYSLRMSIFF